ncbi:MULTISPECIES: YtxH domain-containing protein [Staphylococcus]|uniref:YtxH domain-containing protein n=1 Tax=Staphylococcus xylosus TaxID=1288 RepID=A0A418IMG2_STAXY|nr:YtxH domain-containing protein [Staphylococcus xylosus]MBF0814284.1 YtxH domain-containing protein [Staphylococcus saprophyticus]MRF37926.1 YtxH domain-containing protein [Staphylococcus sp. KY49P]NQD97969.1 YtxH domain-containing protein [Staphylococcus xylosus]PTI08499.1 YtxH domain-containing protein [Staphylococcus xylosus]RIN10036.1 YtxH domain-containing protein [Staphylococcus xylosus]
MKTAQILLGLGAGVATGLGVALMNRDKKDSNEFIEHAKKPVGAESEFDREINTIKQSINDITNYIAQIKSESTEFGSSIGDEVKTMIGDFKSDIDPNIEKLQSHIENLQNRGEEITKAFEKDN